MYIGTKWVLHKNSIAIIICLFVVTARVSAADITVTVKVRGTGIPIQVAYVIIGDEKQVETTGDNGIASFSNIDDKERLKIVAPGYEDLKSIYHSTDVALVFYLYPEVVEGEGLEVTEDRIQETVSKISLTTEELLTAPGTQGDPLKVVTSLPGIVEASDSSAEVYMRGSDAEDNIVWVNRAPVGYLYHFGGFQSSINPSLIEDLNLFLGGFPVEYGDALGGVIDVKLRAPRTDKQHYKFDISTIATSILLEGPAGKNNEDGYYAAFRRSYIDLLVSPDTFNQDDDPDANKVTAVPSYYDSQLLYRHKLNNGYLDTYLFAAGDESQFEIIGSAKTDPQLAGQVSNSQEFQTLGINLAKSWNENTDFIMPVAYYHNKRYFHIGQDSNGDPFFVDSESHTLFTQPEIQWDINKENKLTYGIELASLKSPVNAYMSRPPRTGEPDYNFTNQTKYRVDNDYYVNTYAPYIKHRAQWSNSWATIAGLRFTDIRMRDGFEAQEVSPRATVEYNLNKDTLLTATWGRYIQAPSGIELLDGFGNPYLRMEDSEHRIIGVEYQFTPRYSIKTELYHKPATDLVIAVDDVAPNNYTNEGTGESYGIDIFFKRKAENRRLGWLAFSAAKSERTNTRTGETLPFVGDIPLSLTAVWGQPFPGSWNRWDWSFKMKLRSGNLYTPVLGRHRAIPGDNTSVWVPEYADTLSARTPTYFKLDVRLSRTVLFNESKLKYYFDIQNVTFSNNVTGYDYGFEYEKINNPDEITGLGFFPFFGVEIEF